MKLLGLTLLELKSLVETKKISSKELFEYFLKRIKKYNPKLNGYLTVCDYPRNNIAAGRLVGIPIAVKDNYCTKGIRTTASSKVLDDFIPPYESTVTQKLLNEGMIIMGKANMDAWAHGASTETSDYGVTKNPWDTTRYPGGSSGGTAAIISSYLAPAGLGTDTGGSIRHPASWCGIVGLKPSYGRSSRYGLVAMGSSFDCPGPMGTSVEDISLLLQIFAGKDPYDATTVNIKVPNYLKEIKLNKKIRIGVAEEYFDGVDEGIKLNVNRAIKIFTKMGHEIKKVRLIHPKFSISVYTILQRAEVSSNLSRFDGVRYANNRTFFEKEAKKRIMLGTYTLSHGYYDAYYKHAQKIRTLIVNDFKRIFSEVDLVIGPNTPVTALKIGEFKKYPFFGELMDQLNEPASVAGIPAISIPIGLDKNNLPVGLQIMGKYFNEETILNLAYQFERETEFFGVIKKGVERYK